MIRIVNTCAALTTPLRTRPSLLQLLLRLLLLSKLLLLLLAGLLVWLTSSSISCPFTVTFKVSTSVFTFFRCHKLFCSFLISLFSYFSISFLFFGFSLYRLHLSAFVRSLPPSKRCRPILTILKIFCKNCFLYWHITS